MACIEINSLTKDYGNGRGVFDISLSVEQGETFGFAGINGAGKTTTIRQLMGFLRPESGKASIRTCDRVALIKDGKIVTIANMNDIRHNKDKSYKIEFKDETSYKLFLGLGYNSVNIKPGQLQLTVNLNDSEIGRLVSDLKALDVLFFKEIKHSLEEYFNEIFKEESNNVQ